jgi:hypothetical protein
VNSLEKEKKIHPKLKIMFQQLDKVKASSIIIRLDNGVTTGKYDGVRFEISPDSDLSVSWKDSKKDQNLTFTTRINNLFIGAGIEANDISRVLITRHHTQKDDSTP